MKPVIGISSQYDRGPNRYSIISDYVDFLESAGANAVVVPPCASKADAADVMNLCDGLLVPGGADIDPALYGECFRLPGDEPNPKRDAAETELVRLALARNTPYLGICRGMQMANVALGGSLFQDLKRDRGGTLDHWQKEPYSEPHHRIRIEGNTPLDAVLHMPEIMVNSMHHQGINEIAPGLEAMARSDDGLIEALFHPGAAFFWCVQWHPEYCLESKASRAIGKAFAEACSTYAHNRKR